MKRNFTRWFLGVYWRLPHTQSMPNDILDIAYDGAVMQKHTVLAHSNVLWNVVKWVVPYKCDVRSPLQ